jgi:hypothetical protein
MLVHPLVGWLIRPLVRLFPYHFENWLRPDCFEKRRKKRKSADVENWLRRNCFAPGNGCPFLFSLKRGFVIAGFFIMKLTTKFVIAGISLLKVSLLQGFIVTENTKYALRVANFRAADRPAGDWPPEGHIVVTP